MARRTALRSTSVAVLVTASLLLAGCGDDGDDEAGTASTTTTEAEATTTSTGASSTTAVASTTTAEPTETTAPTSDDQPEQAIWPFAVNPSRYEDPVDAAASFAAEYLGFPSPDPGEFQQGDARSGEVPIQPKPGTGPVTTVLVRQLGDDDSWWVIGASTPNISASAPEALATVTSPIDLAGESTAFEATVSWQVRQDESVEPLAEGTVMGGSNGTMGPFTGTAELDRAPTEGAGAVLFLTYSAEDGSVQEASVIRVRFGG